MFHNFPNSCFYQIEIQAIIFLKCGSQFVNGKQLKVSSLIAFYIAWLNWFLKNILESFNSHCLQ